MKAIIKIYFALLIAVCCFFTAIAQTKSSKKAAKEAETAQLVEAKNYVFVANYVNPFRGGGRSLTSEYDFTVTKDSLIAFLPYFGRAYLSDYGSIDNGIKFTSTQFDYQVTKDKKGGWDIFMAPKDANTTDANAVKQLRLNISADGYASLQIISLNRDPITFDGDIEKRESPKSL